MIKREAALLVMMIFTGGLTGGCNRDVVPEPIDLVQVAADVDAKIAVRRAHLSTAAEKNGAIDASSRVGVTLLVEFIEVPKGLMNDYSAENLIRNDADDFRRQAQIWMKAKQARLFDMMMAHCRNQQVAKFSSLRDIYFPGTYELELDSKPSEDKPEADQGDDDSDKEVPQPPARANVDFEVREIGSMLIFSPTIVDHQTIEIEVNPALSFRLDKTVWESKAPDSSTKIETPVFHSVKVDSTVTVKNGGYAFLGAHALPKEKQSDEFDGAETILLMFVRADSF